MFWRLVREDYSRLEAVDAMFIEDIRACVEDMDRMIDAQTHTSLHMIRKPRPE